MSKRFQLYCTEGVLQGKEYSLDSSKLTIGRLEDNDVILADKKCSGHHGEIRAEQSQWVFYDNNSSNGTLINNQSIQEHSLLPGDQILIGDTLFIFAPEGLSMEEALRYSKKEKNAESQNASLPNHLPLIFGVGGVVFLLLLGILFFRSDSSPETNTEKTQTTQEKTTKEKKAAPKLTEGQRYEIALAKIAQLQRGLKFEKALEKTEDLLTQIVLLERKKELKHKIAEDRKIAALINVFFAKINEPNRPVYYPKGSEFWVGLAAENHLATVQDCFFQLKKHPWEKIPLVNIFELIYEFQIAEDEDSSQAYAASLLALRYKEKEWANRFLVLYLAKNPDKQEEIEELYQKHIGESIRGYVVFRNRLIPPREKEKILAQERGTREKEQKSKLAQELAKRKEELRKLELQVERDTFEERMSRLNGAVKVYQYTQAIKEYQHFKSQLSLPDLIQKVDKRIEEVNEMVSLFDRLIAQINEGKFLNKRMKFGASAGYLKKANLRFFELSFKEGGKAIIKWQLLYPKQLYRVFNRIKLTTNDQWLIAVFCYENGLEKEANENFITVLEKKSPVFRDKVNKYLAHKLEVPIPEGGFTPYKGILVSPEEKEMRSKGFVKYAGRWVTPEDRKKYLAGFVPHDGKWVTQKDKSLLEQGFSRYKGQWYSRDEISAIRSKWQDAWTLTTSHYEIKSNVSEEFITELGDFLEGCYQEYVQFFGTDIQKKSTIFAFRTFEDYRNYCIETKNEAHLKADGFATSRNNTGCGWMRGKNYNGLLWTLAHEGAHLYYFNAYRKSRAPSWYAEASATQFEGYKWNPKKKEINFNFISKRLRGLKIHIARKRTFALVDLLSNNAGTLINQSDDSNAAAIFYAQCWGLYYFLSHTENVEYQDKWLAFQKEMHEFGGSSLFIKHFGTDLQQLEQDFESFILNLTF